MSQTGEWMRVSEVAQDSGVSPSTVRRNVASGTWPVLALAITPRRILIHRESWKTWLEGRLINANTGFANTEANGLRGEIAVAQRAPGPVRAP